LKKHYVLIGIGVATLAAVTVVVIGASADGGGTTATRDQTTAGLPLPSGHPSVSGSGTGDPSAQRTVSQLEAASKADPQNQDLLLKLGDALFLGQRYREAGKAFRSVLRLAPGNAAAIVRLAMVWHANGDSPRALATLKEVLIKWPKDQEAHFYLAIVYFSQQDTDRAKTEWTIAARLDPASAIGRRAKSFVDLLEGKQSTEPSTGGE
jgi:tetratricopeptide (TPR) repeat protein